MYKPLFLFFVLVLILASGCDDPVGSYHGYDEELLEDTEMSDMPMAEPGIADPYYHKPDELVIPDDVGVIGIEVDGTFRAFLKQGMSEIDQHVVHVTQNGKRLTIAYCNMTNCTRVFVPAEMSTGEIRMGGLIKNQMALEVQGKRYRIDNDQIPLEQYPLTETSWGEWKKAHPDTEIYIGMGMLIGPTVVEGARPPRSTEVGQV
mgnify:CR=1 FL=1